MYNLKLILIIVLFSMSQSYSQDSEEDPSSLLSKATTYYSNNQIALALESVLDYIDHYPNNQTARKIVSTIINTNYQMLTKHIELLKRALPYISSLENNISYLIVLAYNDDYEETLTRLLLSLSTLDPEKLYIYADILNKIDANKNPVMVEKIYKIVTPYLIGNKIDFIPAYYHLKRIDKINEILNYYKQSVPAEILSDSTQINSINSLILNLPIEVDPKTYINIFNTFIEYLSKENYFNLSIIYYNTERFTQLDALLAKLALGLQVPKNISVDDILSMDPDIDINRYKLLFAHLLQNFHYDSLVYLNNNDKMYELSKRYFAAGYLNETNALMAQINSKISSEIQSMRTYTIWGFSSVANGESYRAQKLFDNVATFGNAADIIYLKKELNWWYSHNLDQEVLGKFTKIYFTDDYKPPTTVKKEYKEENKKEEVVNTEIDANYYSLIIAVQEYENDKLNLRYPISDSEQLYDVLTTKYLFPREHVIFLKNPKRKDIIKSLSDLRKQLSVNDNLLIYYAGHGQWDEELNQGFWLPSDAQPNDLSNWISNSDIRDYIKAINTKHSLLIADACFSGGIFKTREVFSDADKSILELYNSVSRKAITSGYIKSVPDKSVFLQYLVKFLNENKQKYLGTERLYLSFRDAVTNNSPLNQTPLYGVIWDSGDEGGDFIFVKK